MGLLDKLKPQPRWKHTDPSIRLEGVRELDDAVELVALAETDPDVRVRRAALSRVDDPDALARIAGGDPEVDLRDRAADRLMAIACRGTGPEGGADEAAGLRAVAGLTDARRLATVAKSDAPETVRTAALGRITDQRALGSIARQARHESTAVAALAHVADGAELIDIAENAGGKDVALAAFERLLSPDLSTLRHVELRSQHKPVSRRARQLIQDIETAEAARQAAALDRQRRESALVEAVEALASGRDPVILRSELSRLTSSWQALGVSEAAAVDRFSRASARVEEAARGREADIETAAEQARAKAEAIATRVALAERVETLDGDDMLAQLASLEEEWQSLAPLGDDESEADRLAARFTRAVGACRRRHELRGEIAAARAALEAFVTEAETLPAAADHAEAERRWNVLSKEARELASGLATAARPAADLTDRLRAVGEVFAARDTARQAESEAARATQLAQLRRLADRARRASEADVMTLREGDRLMRDLASGLEEAASAEPTPEWSAIANELQTWQEKVAPRVRELREMDEWRKFANAQRQEQLISMADAIVASLKADDDSGKTSDLPATAKALRELHAEWQKVAEAPRQNAQRLWDQFRTATDFMRSRCEPYFAKRREERESSRTRRLQIVEEAELLSASSDWGTTAGRLQALQTEWQSLGRLGTDSERELGTRFRTACNAFFVRRREDLADRKKVWSDNLAEKESLCERAEALAESTDWDAAAAEMKRLQAAWKTVGPVRKNKSDAVWARFRTAADQFFERYHHRHELALAGKLAEREAWVVELEGLAGLPLADTPGDAADTVQRLRTTWNRAVPIPTPAMKALTDRWQAAFAGLFKTKPQLFTGTDLDPTAVITRMEKLVARVESMAVEAKPAAESRLSPTEQLAAKLRSALASNAMGGRAHEDTKGRGASDSAKDALTAWQRLPPIETPEAEALRDRFRNACRRLGLGDVGRRAASHAHKGKDAPAPPRIETEREVATV